MNAGILAGGQDNRSVKTARALDSGGSGGGSQHLSPPDPPESNALLLRDNPPLFVALVLSASRDFRLRLFPFHHRTGSQVPHQSLNQVHAAFMPETIRAVSRLPLDLSRKWRKPSVLISSILFRHFISGSLSFVSLIDT